MVRSASKYAGSMKMHSKWSSAIAHDIGLIFPMFIASSMQPFAKVTTVAEIALRGNSGMSVTT